MMIVGVVIAFGLLKGYKHSRTLQLQLLHKHNPKIILKIKFKAKVNTKIQVFSILTKTNNNGNSYVSQEYPVFPTRNPACNHDHGRVRSMKLFF